MGATLTAGLVASGLALMGQSASALSWWKGKRGLNTSLVALEGDLGEAQELRLNGRLTRVTLCRSELSPQAVLKRYTRQADAERAADTPYLLETHPEGGSLLWTTSEGLNKAVLVQADPLRRGRSLYRLVLDARRAPLALPTQGGALGPGGEEAALPGGLPTPSGCRVAFSLAHKQGGGTAILLGKGDPAGLAARILRSLKARGYTTRPEDERALKGVQGAGSRAHPLAIPLQHSSGKVSALLSVTRASGGSRATLSLRTQ